MADILSQAPSAQNITATLREKTEAFVVAIFSALPVITDHL